MSIHCSIRHVELEATPEERVRQHLLSWMIQEGGYPKSLIAVEKMISPLKRRLDVIVYALNTLSPLLLVECKAHKLNSSALRQLIGYNFFIKAPFLLLVAKEEIKFGTYSSEKGWTFVDRLPSFDELCIAN